MGTIRRKLRISYRFDNFIVDLDEPIMVNHSTYKEVIVRERILGKYIGSNEETEVRLMAPKNKIIKAKENWNSLEDAGRFTILLK